MSSFLKMVHKEETLHVSIIIVPQRVHLQRDLDF